MRSLSVFGTSSDAGKSTLALALCLIFQKRGLLVAPFKAQNMSNNAGVCDDGGEIGIAQYAQARALGIPTSYHLNPVLLKPQKDTQSQVVINGKAEASQSAREYFLDMERLKPVVREAFAYLAGRYDLLVCEGAGSPVELNLTEKDLSNTFVAREFGTGIVLVADIERGGVFASVFGTYMLLEEKLKANVIGVIINKFRGDMSLFDEGRKIIEDRFGIPVLGVVPHLKLSTSYEDALSISNYKKSGNPLIRMAVVRLPHISNFTDFEPFIADERVAVEFIEGAAELGGYDIVMLPGTKATIADLRWLKAAGLFDALKTAKKLFGICGGYQMLFASLHDPLGIESEAESVEEGLGYIDDVIVFEAGKQLKKGEYEAFGKKLSGYEIHCGVSQRHPLWYESERVSGSHLHGLFENDAFRTMLLKSLNPGYEGYAFDAFRKEEERRLAETVEAHLDVDAILRGLAE